VSIETTTTKIRYDGDGAEITFPYTWKIFSDSDLVVLLYHTDSWTVQSNYTVTGVGDSTGGNVVMDTPPVTDDILLIYHNKSYKQETLFEENSSFHAETAESTYDKNVILSQQLKEIIERSIGAPITDLNPVMELPSAEDRANRYLSFDINGDVTTSGSKNFLEADPGNLNYSGETTILNIKTNSKGITGTLHTDTDGTLIEAKADSYNTMPCHYLALTNNTGNQLMLVSGFVRNDNWSWTPGGTMYVSTTTGEMTQTEPVDFGSGELIQELGWAVKSNIVYFRPFLELIEKK
jgi:hypothetical protein